MSAKTRKNAQALWVALISLSLIACETPDTFTTGGQDIPVAAGQTKKWSFDSDAAGTLPADFISVLGDWKVAAEGTAPSSPNVLRQSGSFNNPDFPRVLVKDLTFTDLKLKVRCRPESGSTDEACGILFRAADSNNYYITRANALEGNVRLYRVVNRDRQQFGDAQATVTRGQWHTLEVSAKGSTLTVSWDGAPVINATDPTFARGKIGLWTKADSVTAFDDLEATAQ